MQVDNLARTDVRHLSTFWANPLSYLILSLVTNDHKEGTVLGLHTVLDKGVYSRIDDFFHHISCANGEGRMNPAILTPASWIQSAVAAVEEMLSQCIAHAIVHLAWICFAVRYWYTSSSCLSHSSTLKVVRYFLAYCNKDNVIQHVYICHWTFDALMAVDKIRSQIYYIRSVVSFIGYIWHWKLMVWYQMCESLSFWLTRYLDIDETSAIPVMFYYEHGEITIKQQV